MRRLLLLALACLCLTNQARAQRDFSKVEIKATKVAGNVYMLEGAGGNIGVSVGPDGLLIVDDQFAPLAEKIRAALQKLSDGKLRYILNTHWHGDHTGGNVKFGAEGTIIAHDNVRKRLAAHQEVKDEKSTALPAVALPVITFNHTLTVHFNGEEIRALHLPHGHTDGDSVILFTKSQVVHMGDDFFAGRFPFVDLESGGDVEGLVRNVEQVIGQLPTGVKIIPGHGPVSTIEDLRNYQRMLVETTNIIRGRMTAGQTLEQIKAAGLPETWKDWGSGFIKTEQWIETVYRSLSKGRN